MYFLREHTMIILCVVTVIESEQWYSATIFTNEPSGLKSNGSKLKDTITQNYSPLFVSTQENRTHNKLKWRFSQNDFVKSHKPTPSPDSVDRQSFKPFENSKSPGNSSVSRPTRPRRKVPKRCTSMEIIPKRQQHVKQGRKGKFLDVFEVVQFEHVSCISSSGLEGTCLHEYDCLAAGGSTMGSCADHYGTCCIIQYICDGSYSSPIGWLTNSDFPAPSSERISCTISINKSALDIKQLRLDFLYFEMLPPNLGTCEEDQFIITGQNRNNVIPKLCGINTGQHVYVEVGDVDGPILLSVQTVTAENRLYAIKVTQLTRSDELAAPSGCLQYYTEANGYLQSFNYRDNSEIGSSRHPGYLNNLNYAMCIKRTAMSCSITYTNAGEMQIPNYDTDGLPIIPPRQAGVEIFNCPSDWLLISAIRLCGERLNDGSVIQDFSLDAPVTDNGAGPIVIWFRSDGGYVGRGFNLHYEQNTCAVSK